MWDQIIARCEVYLARTAVDEAHFYPDAHCNQQPIGLTPHINASIITVFALKPSDVAGLRAQFDAGYFEKLDPGETDSLGGIVRSAGIEAPAGSGGWTRLRGRR